MQGSFRSLSIFVFSVIIRDECYNGATYSAVGLMKVVQILTKLCLDTLKAFNLHSMYTHFHKFATPLRWNSRNRYFVACVVCGMKINTYRSRGSPGTIGVDFHTTYRIPHFLRSICFVNSISGGSRIFGSECTTYKKLSPTSTNIKHNTIAGRSPKKYIYTNNTTVHGSVYPG